eukprot:m.212434 g.212434  ORF g.212434 m.212434 type:complete len:276 (+) comp18587_c0_seq2:160-987(+)
MYDALDGVWEHLYGGPVAHGTRLCLTSALCCMLLAFVIRGILRMVLARLPAYAGLPVSQRVLIANKGPSLVHAIVATVFGFQSMTDPELTSNPIYGMNDKLVVRASATLGYMLFDTYALFEYWSLMSSGEAFVVHHVATLTAVYLGITHRVWGALGAMCMCCLEATGIFFALVRIINDVGLGDSVLQMVCGTMFFLSWIIFRVILFNWKAWELMVLPVWAELEAGRDLSVDVWAGVVICSALGFLNVVWTFGVCRAYVKKMRAMLAGGKTAAKSD